MICVRAGHGTARRGGTWQGRARSGWVRYGDLARRRFIALTGTKEMAWCGESRLARERLGEPRSGLARRAPVGRGAVWLGWASPRLGLVGRGEHWRGTANESACECFVALMSTKGLARLAKARFAKPRPGEARQGKHPKPTPEERNV